MGLSFSMSQGLQVTISPKLNKHWNHKLRPIDDEGNERFPLAPVEMRNNPTLSLKQIKRCRQQDAHYGKECSQYVIETLHSLREKHTEDFFHDAVLSYIGVGLGRERAFIPEANKLGIKVHLIDASDQAVKNGEQLLHDLNVWGQNIVYQQEVTGDDSDIARDTILLYEGSFLQVLRKKRMQDVMKMHGRYLALPHRQAIICHPFPEDNEDVVWGDTTPYTIKQLLDPAERELGRKINIINPKKFMFHHQTYTIFKMV